MTTEEEAMLSAIRDGRDKDRFGVTRSELEALGERAVRDELNSGNYGHPDSPSFLYVPAWLANVAFTRQEASSSKALSIASEANSIARLANKIAIAAATFAAAATIIAAVISVIYAPVP